MSSLGIPAYASPLFRYSREVVQVFVPMLRGTDGSESYTALRFRPGAGRGGAVGWPLGGGGARAGTENTMPVFLGSRLDICASTQGFSRLIYCFRLPGGLGRRTQLGAPRCTVFLRSPARVPDLRPAMHSIYLPHLYFLCTTFQDHYLC